MPAINFPYCNNKMNLYNETILKHNNTIYSTGGSGKSGFYFTINTKLDKIYKIIISAELIKGKSASLFSDDICNGKKIIDNITHNNSNIIKTFIGNDKQINIGFTFDENIECELKIISFFVDIINEYDTNSTSRVSVILPTLNRSNKCIKVIKQILEQTYDNIELFVVDDGSINEHYTIKKKFIQSVQDNRIFLIKNDCNIGIAASINKALRLCTGSYVTWVSDDNNYMQNYISDLIPINADFKYSAFEYNNFVSNTNRKIDIEYNGINDLLQNFRGLAAFMWNKKFMDKIKFYNVSINGVEDYEYLLRTFLYASKIEYTDVITMKYNHSELSLFENGKSEILALKLMIDKIYSHMIPLLTYNTFLIYYSQTPYSLLVQRPHQIMKNYDKNIGKIFITSENIINYDKKCGLLIVPYSLYTIVFNILLNKNLIIYYTDSRLCDEVDTLKENYNVQKIIFDLIDKPVEEFSIWKPKLDYSVNQADIVLYSHVNLFNDLIQINNSKDYHYLSNGAEYDHFSKASTKIYPKPFDIPNTNKLIIGYYGAFSNWIDYDILLSLANTNKCHILMIGGIPNNENYNIRVPHSNITYLDHKPYEELPHYLSWFDVCIIPFKKCKLIKYINPCKLWEYMAANKQIFVTHFLHCDYIKQKDQAVNNKLVKIKYTEFDQKYDYKSICKQLFDIINKRSP
jgi:glycosyltransferase involved in cell wall biosynthesis